MVNGGLIPNWCARAGCEISSSCITDDGVDVPERAMSSTRWEAADLMALGSRAVSSGTDISPGATSWCLAIGC